MLARTERGYGMTKAAPAIGGKEEHMEEYKRTKELLGSSDIAALVTVGIGDGIETEAISYGADGSYSAYIVRDRNLIPDHYHVAWATTE